MGPVLSNLSTTASELHILLTSGIISTPADLQGFCPDCAISDAHSSHVRHLLVSSPPVFGTLRSM